MSATLIAVAAGSSSSHHILARNEAREEKSEQSGEGERLMHDGDDGGNSGLRPDFSEPTRIASEPQDCGIGDGEIARQRGCGDAARVLGGCCLERGWRMVRR